MASQTAIQWTERTWNPVVGCSKVSPGCAHCYAEVMAHRLRKMALADIAAGKDPGRKRHYIDAVDDRGRWTGKLVPVPEALGDPLKWKKPCRVFVNSMSDLFHEDVPTEFIVECFATMLLAQRHTFQVLTKRPERMRRIVRAPNFGECVYDMAFHLSHQMTMGGLIDSVPETDVLPNVWLGVSVERQQEADERIPLLLQTPAAVRFLSCEPLIAPVDLDPSLAPAECKSRQCWPLDQEGPRIGWVIVGGESGPGARPCHVRWVRSLVEQCKAAGVACFVKQLGVNVIDANVGWPEGTKMPTIGGRVELADSKGGDWDEWPADLQIREFPRT